MGMGKGDAAPCCCVHITHLDVSKLSKSEMRTWKDPFESLL